MRYLSKTRLVQSGYMFVDSADANNIYLWIASDAREEMSTIKYNINVNINNIKTMTSETYPLNPVDVYYLDNSYLEITISDNSIFSNVVIA